MTLLVSTLARSAVATLIALILIELLWEWWLAPLRPGGSWLVLKVVPLALLLPGVMRGAGRTVQWLLLLLPFYFAEALVRAMTDGARSSACASVAAVLCIGCFAACLALIRAIQATMQR